MKDVNKIILIGGAFVLLIALISYFWFFEMPPPGKEVAAPDFLIPSHITINGEPDYDGEKLHFRDYSNVMHGIFMFGGMSRTSELGHENYRPDLATYDMQERGERWLQLIGEIENRFEKSGHIAPYMIQRGESFYRPDRIDLSVYADASYAYHMHHRAGRFEDHGLFDLITRRPARYISDMGRYLLDEHYGNGTFSHSDGSVDNNSMAWGLGGIHGHVYAWVVWKKPEGADNMGLLSEEQLINWLGYDAQDLVVVMREVLDVMDEAWSDEMAMYDFGGGFTWDLEALGSLIRGKKAMYETLFMFGDEYAQEEALIVFERTAKIVEQALELVQPWGLPSALTFDEDGARAASETVDLHKLYSFMNHLGGGFGFDREREGSSEFIATHRPDLSARLGEVADIITAGALDHHFRSGRLVSSVSYSDGSVVDERTSASAIGMFLTAAGNIYLNGERFVRADRWDGTNPEAEQLTRRLYDLMMAHVVLLERQFLVKRVDDDPRRAAVPEE